MAAKPIRRVMLVQRRVGDSAGPAPVRRYSLARVGPSTVSALGADRFERMEEIAGMDDGGVHGPGRKGTPNGMPFTAPDDRLS